MGILVAILYVAIAISLFVYVGRKFAPGPLRAFLRATVIALFFAFGIVTNHGAAPIPFMAIVIGCLFGQCAGVGGPYDFLVWVLMPVAIQWAILVGIFMAWHALTSRRKARLPEA